jgi:ubiquinone/menaquinone biosynthesis C-methylase UbiE
MADLASYYDQLIANSPDDPIATARTRDTEESLPPEVRALLPNIAAEIKTSYHEYGASIPPALEGLTVLDLGCGTGRDTYIVSNLVGENGRVIGFDPDPAKLAIARKYQNQEAEQFGYAASNVEFIQGYYEDLSAVPSESVDVVISNCVLNTAQDKERALREIFRVLKEEGELFLTDVFCDRRIPKSLADDMKLRATRLSGALYYEDFRRLTQKVGWPNFRYYARRKTPRSDDEAKALDGYLFATLTIRAIKNQRMEDICEDYHHTITYLGTIPGYEDAFRMDEDHLFTTGEGYAVCGITAACFGYGHYGPHFKLDSDYSVHYGDIYGSPLIRTAPEYSDVIDEDNLPVNASCC